MTKVRMDIPKRYLGELGLLASAFVVSACSTTSSPKPTQQVHVQSFQHKIANLDFGIGVVTITPDNKVRVTVSTKQVEDSESAKASIATYRQAASEGFKRGCKRLKGAASEQGISDAEKEQFTVKQNIPTWTFTRNCA